MLFFATFFENMENQPNNRQTETHRDRQACHTVVVSSDYKHTTETMDLVATGDD